MEATSTTAASHITCCGKCGTPVQTLNVNDDLTVTAHPCGHDDWGTLDAKPNTQGA